MLLGAAAGELLGEQDEDVFEGEDDGERRKNVNIHTNLNVDVVQTHHSRRQLFNYVSEIIERQYHRGLSS